MFRNKQMPGYLKSGPTL